MPNATDPDQRPRDPVPDSIWSEADKQFDEQELRLDPGDPSINVWNRLNVAVRQPRRLEGVRCLVTLSPTRREGDYPPDNPATISQYFCGACSNIGCVVPPGSFGPEPFTWAASVCSTFGSAPLVPAPR